MEDRKRYVEGLFISGSSYVIWGLLPLFWKVVKAVSPYLLFGYRVVCSFLFVIFLLAVTKKLPQFKKYIKTPRTWLVMLLPAVFISINWLLYIWAVNNGYIIESSLGYFMIPLIMAAFGKVFFKEKISRFQIIGIISASIGIIIKYVMFGKIPFVGLGLAVAFSLYGLSKKKSPLDSLNGLGVETVIAGIPALGYVLFTEISGNGIATGFPAYYWLLMLGSGVVTALPMLLYGEGTKRLPLTAVGFLQYISPMIMLVLGVFVFDEPFKTQDIIPFVFIWIGLIFFSYSQYKLLSKKNRDEKTGGGGKA